MSELVDKMVAEALADIDEAVQAAKNRIDVRISNMIQYPHHKSDAEARLAEPVTASELVAYANGERHLGTAKVEALYTRMFGTPTGVPTE